MATSRARILQLPAGCRIKPQARRGFQPVSRRTGAGPPAALAGRRGRRSNEPETDLSIRCSSIRTCKDAVGSISFHGFQPKIPRSIKRFYPCSGQRHTGAVVESRRTEMNRTSLRAELVKMWRGALQDKNRFAHIDGGGRQESDAEQCLQRLLDHLVGEGK